MAGNNVTEIPSTPLQQRSRPAETQFYTPPDQIRRQSNGTTEGSGNYSIRSLGSSEFDAYNGERFFGMSNEAGHNGIIHEVGQESPSWENREADAVHVLQSLPTQQTTDGETEEADTCEF